MSNLITATIVFSFKGKTHKPSLQLDLDQYMQHGGQIPELCPLIAKANNFDLYSYEFEMMQAEPVEFSNAEGLVKKFVVDNILDIQAFESAWIENKLLEDLQAIASRNMKIDNLENNPELKATLLEAYRLGEANIKKTI